MRVNYVIGDDGRIQSVTRYPLDESIPMIDVTGGQFERIHEYKLIGGELVHAPLPEDNSARVEELKRMLNETDYVVIKIAEGAATVEEYADVIQMRQEWRDEINELKREGNGNE